MLDQRIMLVVGVLLLFAAVYILIHAMRRRETQPGGNHQEAGQLQGELRDEKAKSAIILSAIEDGVVLLDTSGNIDMFNKGASQITGWPQEEAVKLDCDAVIKLEDIKNTPYEEADNPLHKVFVSKQIIRDDKAMLVTRSDKRVAISLTVSPLIDEANGSITGAVAVFRDVTASRAQEQQRAEFISTASHEMRTPVAAIEGYLALALNDKVATIDERARSYLSKAHASTQHLGHLFQDLLTSAKAEDGRLSSHPVVIEMGSYLERLADDLKFAAEKKKLFMEFIMGTGDVIDASSNPNAPVVKPLYYVHADPDRLREVITNLFDNACKYTENGKITIGLTSNHDVVQFYIRDTGHGIPAEDVPHLFQKFYRVDNSATRTVGGTGLGLFICRKIIELYDGRIWVESELEKGSTFYVNLPRIDSARAEQLKAADAGNARLPEITSLAETVVQ